MSYSIKVQRKTWEALKIASARLQCSIIDLLARVETGDREALREWVRTAREEEERSA